MMQEDTKGRALGVLYYIGCVLVVLAGTEVIALGTSLIYQEWKFVFIFIISICIMLGVGLGFICLGAKHRHARLSLGEGMAVAAGAWLVGMLLCALPYYFSGNYLSYLDSCFDVMSGLTTTGLTLIQDMDHLANGLNMWRFILTYIGGQGMVVLALVFLTNDTASTYKIYVGEAKDEKLMPSAVHTSRAIWKISLIYLGVGWIVMSIAGLVAGMPLSSAILHGLWIFVSGWSTGGFAPMSQNILYYHSFFYEIATVIFFVIGSFNFALHYAVLTGKRKEIRHNIEIISFTVTVTILTLVVCFGLMRNNVYPDFIAMFRKGFYQLISGHTTTGFMSLYARQLYHEWGDMALFGMTVAMLLGGSACSTAGGFKGLRIGILFKAIKEDINKYTMPESRVYTTRIHHIKDIILTDSLVRSTAVIVLLYIVTFAISILTGMSAGYSLVESAFEGASATGNVGLSIGITSVSSPAYYKVSYIVIMWLARLEFLSVLTLIGQIRKRVRKR